MYGNGGNPADMAQWNAMQQMQTMQPQAAAADPIEAPEMEETDNSHRPPNAFILYSQAMRTQARQDNPSLSNTEVSSLLGKMWKEVPAEIKLQYKQKAAALQEQFKREHPDYTYRKARRKRALNELLTKSTSGVYGQFPMAGFPMQMAPGQDLSQFQMPNQAFQMQGFPGMQMPQGMTGLPGMPQPQGQMTPGMPGIPGISQPQDQSGQNNMFMSGMGAQSQMQGFPGMNGMTPQFQQK